MLGENNTHFAVQSTNAMRMPPPNTATLCEEAGHEDDQSCGMDSDDADLARALALPLQSPVALPEVLPPPEPSEEAGSEDDQSCGMDSDDADLARALALPLQSPVALPEVLPAMLPPLSPISSPQPESGDEAGEDLTVSVADSRVEVERLQAENDTLKAESSAAATAATATIEQLKTGVNEVLRAEQRARLSVEATMPEGRAWTFAKQYVLQPGAESWQAPLSEEAKTAVITELKAKFKDKG
jgi:hypothetical protein